MPPNIATMVVIGGVPFIDVTRHTPDRERLGAWRDGCGARWFAMSEREHQLACGHVALGVDVDRRPSLLDLQVGLRGKKYLFFSADLLVANDTPELTARR